MSNAHRRPRWPGYGERYDSGHGFDEVLEEGAFGDVSEESVRRWIFEVGLSFMVDVDEWDKDDEGRAVRTIKRARVVGAREVFPDRTAPPS